MRVILVRVSPLRLTISSFISPGSTILAKSCDEAPRLPALCRPRRRLGWGGGGHDGGRRRPGIDRYSHHYAWRCSSRRVEGGPVRRSGALRSLRRGKTAVRDDARLVCERSGLRSPDG